MIQHIQKASVKPGAEGANAASRAGLHPKVPEQGKLCRNRGGKQVQSKARWPLNFIAIRREVSLWKTFMIRVRITEITHSSVITQQFHVMRQV